ncbi:MAG: NAD(P)-dependent oxidoreductase [Hyphomicrobiaceae bacterium]
MPDLPAIVGFIGLGQMGQPMAGNIAKRGHTIICHDTAGTAERLPEGAQAAASLDEVVQSADTIFLSLPDGPIVNSVAEKIAGITDRRASVVVDLSTIGLGAAKSAAAVLKQAGITYIDAPVSGGRSGAAAGTITLMWAGPAAELERHRAIVDSFCGNPFHVGDAPGQGQAVKLLNNYLSATALAATSEAVLFGQSQGIDMKTILDVVNVSSGMNTATRDKFPQQVLTEKYAAGFYAELLNKDVQLYYQNAIEAEIPAEVAGEVAKIWQHCVDTLAPHSDFTQVFEVARKKLNRSS